MTAFSDINPTTASKAEIARRIRRAREELAMAEIRLNENEVAAALRRLDCAAREASGGNDDRSDT